MFYDTSIKIRVIAMRIALFTESYLPQIGGIVSQVELLKNNLISLGHMVLVVASSPTAKEFYTEGDALYCPAKPSKNEFGYAAADNGSPEFFDILNEFAPDILHIHTLSPIGRVAIKYASLKDLPIVYTIHQNYEDLLHYRIGKLALEPVVRLHEKKRFRDFCDNADIITCPSKRALSLFKENRIERDFTIVSHSADLSAFDCNRISMEKVDIMKKKLGLPKNATIAMFAGPLRLEKQVDVLFEQWANELKSTPNLHLLIVGDGPEKKPLMGWAKDLGIFRQITFTGEVLHKDMPLYFAMSHVYVSACTNDLMSTAVLEGLAGGLAAVIRHDSANPRMIKEGINGFTYKTVKEFGAYLRQFASLDNEGRRLLRRVVRKSLHVLPPSQQAKEYLSVYEQAKNLHYYDAQKR